MGTTSFLFNLSDSAKSLITIIGFLIGVLGFALTIYSLVKSNREKRAKKNIKWEDLQSAAAYLSKKIKEARDIPDAIFTFSGRGAVIADLICYGLNHNIPVFVGLDIWKKEWGNLIFPGFINYETNKWYLHIPEIIYDFKSRKILIINDYTMSGDWIEKTRSKLEGFQHIKFLSIVTTNLAKRRNQAPDYYWTIRADDDDFYFPWGKAE